MVNGKFMCIFNVYWPNSAALIEGFCTVCEQPLVDLNPRPRNNPPGDARAFSKLQFRIGELLRISRIFLWHVSVLDIRYWQRKATWTFACGRRKVFIFDFNLLFTLHVCFERLLALDLVSTLRVLCHIISKHQQVMLVTFRRAMVVQN